MSAFRVFSGRVATLDSMEAWDGPDEWEGCQARILQPFDFSHSEPRGRHCSLPVVTELCGIRLCSRHREMVTHCGPDGMERLSPRADREFAAWGVTPTKPFEPLPY